MGISIDYTDGPLSVRKHSEFQGTTASFHAHDGDTVKADFFPAKQGEDLSRDFFCVGVREGESGCTNETVIYLRAEQAEALYSKLGEALAEERKARVGRPIRGHGSY